MAIDGMLSLISLCLVLGVSDPSVQQQGGGKAQPQPSDRSAAAAEPTDPSSLQIIGPDGKPISPELQREIDQQRRKAALLHRSGGAGSGSGDQDATAVVVRAGRPRGSVSGNISPEKTFSATDITAFGAEDVESLLKSLAPQVLGQRDNNNISVLLNGKRVSNFAEIANLPTEAIERIDILPEAAALSYGFPSGQKLINIVTFVRYSSRSVQGSFSAPTEGGHAVELVRPQYVYINENTRVNLAATYTRTDQLLDREAGLPDEVSRSLLPGGEEWSIKSSVNGSLRNVVIGLDAQYTDNRQESLFGDGQDGPIREHLTNQTAHLASVFSNQIGRWFWSLTAGLDFVNMDTLTLGGAVAPLTGSAKSQDGTGVLDLFASGAILDLPEGPVYLTSRSVASQERLTSVSFDAENGPQALRNQADEQINIDIPIAGKSEKCSGPIGCLVAHLRTEAEAISDFHTLWTVDYGVNWQPVPALRLNLSYTNSQKAPALEQLAAPLVIIPGVQAFDAIHGQTDTLTELSGGDEALRTSGYHTLVAGAFIKPLLNRDFTINVDVTRTRVSAPVITFSTASAQLEAAFPKSFQRDAFGDLTEINISPVNALSSEQADVHGGLSFSRSFGSSDPGVGRTIVVPAGNGDIRNALPPGAVVMMADPGSAEDQFIDQSQSRLYVSLLYTYHAVSKVVLPGGTSMDLLRDLPLDGGIDPVRHEIELQAGAFKRGIGSRITVDWRASRLVDGGGSIVDGAPQNLRISSLAKVDLNFFANLEQLLKGESFIGMRVSCGISNLFDARPSAHVGVGAAPLQFTPAYLDPLGRVISVSLRKVW